MFLVLALIIVFVNQAFSQTSGAEGAFSFLSRNEPNVKWNARSEIKGDFDYDGVTDYALRGRKGKFFVLGIVKGNLNSKSKHWTMQFGENAGDQGSLCSVSSAVITVETLDNDYAEDAKGFLEADFIKSLKNLPKNSKGINIADGKCDSFSVLWDKKGKQFFWWRI